MEVKKIWQGVLSDIELTVSRGVYVAFFSQTELLAIEEGVAKIGCHNPYISTILEERYYSLIKSTLEKLAKKEKISLVFKNLQREQDNEKREDKNFGPLFSDVSGLDQREENIRIVPNSAGLRKDFTFEVFAVSPSNQLAYAAAEAVSRDPGKAYNPFFLWGGVGVGKTHLMQAVGWEALKRNPALKVIYCAGEDFTNEIVEAIRQKKTAGFKSRYRNADILLIDDVQFIAGKETVQEEFFHTFNAIHRGGGQIILTSDRSPSEISKLEDRLRSRFEGGMTADIAPPDFELRTAILLIKSKARGKEIPIEAAKILSANIADTRRLEGTLIKMLALSEMKKVPITTELAMEVLGKAPILELKKVTAEEVVAAVCTYFDLKTKNIKGEKRNRPIALPRQILMYLLRRELNLPYMEIGGILGGRDHTTIMHGEEKVANMIIKSERLRTDVEKIRQKIFG